MGESSLLRGTFAEVARGVDERGCAIAVKRVLRATASLAGRDAAQDGALCAAEAAREERILRLVAHANVVGLHATARHSDALVLEWCGADLAQLLRMRAAPLAEAVTKAMFDDLLRGLAACHARSVVHLDVKPANLLLGRDGRLKLADFGNACVLGEAPSAGSTTRWYRAPELLFGARTCDGAVDMWSAGCVLAELLGGAPLLPGENDVDQLSKVHQLLGAPDEQEASWLQALPDYGKVTFSCARRAPLADELPDAPPAAVRLAAKLLRFAAPTRPTAAEAVGDAWFAQLPLPLPRKDVLKALVPTCGF